MCMLYILHQGKFWKALYYAKKRFLKQERVRTAVELGWCREGRGKGKGGRVRQRATAENACLQCAAPGFYYFSLY